MNYAINKNLCTICFEAGYIHAMEGFTRDSTHNSVTSTIIRKEPDLNNKAIYRSAFIDGYNAYVEDTQKL